MQDPALFCKGFFDITFERDRRLCAGQPPTAGRRRTTRTPQTNAVASAIPPRRPHASPKKRPAASPTAPDMSARLRPWPRGAKSASSTPRDAPGACRERSPRRRVDGSGDPSTRAYDRPRQSLRGLLPWRQQLLSDRPCEPVRWLRLPSLRGQPRARLLLWTRTPTQTAARREPAHELARSLEEPPQAPRGPTPSCV